MKVIGSITELIRQVFKGTNRTVTLEPDSGTPAAGDVILTVKGGVGAYSDELTTNDAAQTLTNKALTSPTMTGITVDTVSLDGTKIVEDDKAQSLSNKTISTVDNTITTSASGNLVATDLDSALAELQADVDTRETSSDASNHTGATVAHGVTGNIVGDSDAQDLTNKTYEGAALAVTGTPTVTIPTDVTLMPEAVAFHKIVKTEAELRAACATEGTVGINADITLTGTPLDISAKVELYTTDAKFSLTGATGADSVINVTADEVVINAITINTIDEDQLGIEANETDKGLYSLLNVKMFNQSSSRAIRINGSYNRVTVLLAESNGGSILGVLLDVDSTFNLVSGVVVT